MASPDGREQARLLFYIGIAGAVLCILAVVGAVIIGVLAPLFTDRAPGTLDPAVAFLLLVWAGIALGLIPASALISRSKRDE